MITRISETPELTAIQTNILQMLQATMPKAGPQGFSEDALLGVGTYARGSIIAVASVGTPAVNLPKGSIFTVEGQTYTTTEDVLLSPPNKGIKVKAQAVGVTSNKATGIPASVVDPGNLYTSYSFIVGTGFAPTGLPYGSINGGSDGEVGRILRVIATVLGELSWEVKDFSKQLTPTDVREDYVDAVMASKGLPARLPGEDADTYVRRVVERFHVGGLTMPNIRASMEALGYLVQIYPMGNDLLVPSKSKRLPSTRRGLLPNGRLGKSGVYVIHGWGQNNDNEGVVDLLDSLTSAGYGFRFHHHIHWNTADELVVGPQLVASRRIRKRHLIVRHNRGILTPSTQHGAPSQKGLPLGGKKLSFRTKTKRRTLMAPEADIISYLPIGLDDTNKYLELDYSTSSTANLSYTVNSEVLTIDSTRSFLQAGSVVVKR